MEALRSTQPHVVIFPFMAQGHTLPLIDLSKALSSQGIKVTIFTTPTNAKSILIHVSKHPNISLNELPFPNSDILRDIGLPNGCENTSQLPSVEKFYVPFLLATKHLRKPFEEALQGMIKASHNLRPLCLVSDHHLAWTLAVCRDLGIPRLVFHGMGISSMAVAHSIMLRCSIKAKSSRPNSVDTMFSLDLPDLNYLPFALTLEDLPKELSAMLSGSTNHEELNFDPVMSKLLAEMAESDLNSWGVLVNSFVELETSQSISSLESFYKNGARAWCVGPLNLYDDDIHQPSDDDFVARWLDDHGPGSGSGESEVIYVSFGTQADVSDAQLNEVAHGLEAAGVSFVWAVRSKTWSLPDEVKERLNGKGLVVSKWVNQRRVLLHHAVGGFLSHCGWNSVMESISAEVPILAWPMMADQALNAKLLVEGLGAGIRIRVSTENVIVSREAICEGVRALMGPGEKGRKARERAKALGGVARRAVREGGSSRRTLKELIRRLQCGSNSIANCSLYHLRDEKV